jgi:hypothetical protein
MKSKKNYTREEKKVKDMEFELSFFKEYEKLGLINHKANSILLEIFGTTDLNKVIINKQKLCYETMAQGGLD